MYKNFEIKRRDLNLMILGFLPLVLIVMSFFLEPVKDVFLGLIDIITTPDVLLQDYIATSGAGGAFLNAGLLGLICVYIVKKLNVNITGTVISSILTVTGFGFIGKNILNVWPIFLGGYIYAKFTKTALKDIIAVIFFSTTLAPAISMILFGLNLSWYLALPLAIFTGIAIGFTIVPLSKHMVNSHGGYNIYNIGFVGGLMGIVIASILRAFNLEPATQYIVSYEYSSLIRNLMIFVFLAFIYLGYLKNGKTFKGYNNVFKYSGRLFSTFIDELGYGVAYINIGVMGIITSLYVILVGANFNGPIIAALLTAAGFSPSGKNPANTIPILLGVFITTVLNAFDVASTSIVIAALFGTTLAPIAGVYGFIPGVIAGFLHLCISPNLSSVHAGLHLYNNGFSGGIVAMVMAPILETFFNKKEDII